MSALVLSAMKPMSGQRMLQIQAAKLRLDVMAARSDAISSGMISTVTIDSGHGAWRRGRNAPQILPNGMELFLERPAVSLNPLTREEIVFYPDGTSSGGVLLVKAENTGVKIAIDWLTGYPSRAY
jgi:general secretion pathway protein H